MEGTRRKPKLNTALILAGLALLAVVVILLVFFVFPSTGRLRNGTVESELDFNGVIIRRETVVDGGDFSAIRYLLREGDRVVQQQPVAQLYNKGYDNQLGEILSQSEKIYKQQLTLLRLNSTDTVSLPEQVVQYNEQINSLLARMTETIMGEGQEDHLLLMSQLESLLTQREQLMRQITPADESLGFQYEQLDRLKAAFAAETTLLNNGGDGYISFHLDGYETALNINSLTASQVRRAVSSPLSAAGTGLYRVVDPGGYYIAMTVSNNSPQRLMVGESYELEVVHQNKSIRGRVMAERTGGSYVLYVFEVAEDPFPVLENRSMELKIRYSAGGISVPVEGIYFNNGVPYLYVNTGLSYEPIQIEILCADEDTAVIQAKDRAIQLHSGLKFEYHDEDDEEEAEPTPAPSPEPTPEPTSTPAPTPAPIGSPPVE